MSMKFDVSRDEGLHYGLAQMAGEWEGTAYTWFEPGVIADESPARGTIRVVLDGRFLLHEYKGQFGGKPLEGIAIYGYDLNTGAFQSAWADSFHMGTGILFSSQKKTEGPFSVYGTYTAMQQGREEEWGWRTDLQLEAPDRLVITSYNIEPGGPEVKANEIRYRRKV